MKKITQLVLLLLICWSNFATAQPLTLQKNWWQPNGKVNAIAKHPTKDIVYIGGDFTSVSVGTPYATSLNTITNVPTFVNAAPNNTVYVSIKDGKGGWYLGGDFTSVGDSVRNRIAHINQFGEVTSLFSNYGLDSSVNALALSGDSLFIGGNFKQSSTGNVTNLVAYNVASNVPLNWKPQIGIVNALGILNNTLYVGGNFNAVASQTRYNACAFNLANLQILPWNGGVDICKPKKIITADNSIYFAGYGVIFKVNAQTGAVEWYKNLNIDLAGSINVTAICLTNNVLYWGGMYYNVSGQPSDIWIGKRNAINGNPISNVIPRIGGNAINEIVADTMSDLLYLAGNLNSFFNEPCSNVVTLKISDNTIGSIKPNVNGTVYSLHVLDNSLFLGGSFTSVGGVSRNHAAAYNINTGALTDWNPNIKGSTVNAIAVKDNQVIIGGNFNKVGTQVRNNLVSVDATDATVNPLLANTNHSVRALLLSNNTLYAAGDFTSMNDITREKLAAINLSNNTLTNWNPGANNTVTSLATYNGLIYAGGAFSGIGNKNRNYLAAIDNTGNAISWDANLNNGVNSLIIDNATLYAGGIFTSVGNESRSNLASFNLTNNTLNNWLCNTNGAVYAMAVQGNYLLLGGAFTSIANQNRYNIAAVNKTVSEQLTSWSPVVTGNKVACILTTDSMVFIGGDYRAIGGLNSPNFSVYSDKIFPTNTDFLTTDLQSLQVVEQGASLPIQVQSNTNWRVVSSASWLTSNITNSSNNQVITVTAQANLTPHIRSAYISISTGVVTKYVIVKQDANTTLLSFSSDTLWYKYAGGMQTVIINCNRTWSAHIADNWVVSNINSDSLTKVIEVTLAANSNKLRLSEITITAGLISKSIKIVQEGLDSALTISADTMWFDGLGGTQAVVVSSYQNWVVNSFDSWVATSRFSGIGTGTNQIIVEQNNTSLPRTAKLEWISDTIKRNLVIMQDGFVGITENKVNEFKLYPNPSTGNFTLENPSAQAIQVQVYDVLGKQYLDETMPAQSNQGFKMDAQPGVYFVKLSTQQSQQTIKLVVQ